MFPGVHNFITSKKKLRIVFPPTIHPLFATSILAFLDPFLGAFLAVYAPPPTYLILSH